MAFEKSSLDIIDKQYIESDAAQRICFDVMTMIENDVSEHKYYRLGSQFFSNPESEQSDVKLKIISNLFGDNWQKIRFHNLVRLGGDIQASGLGEYHKATIMGAFLAYSKSE